MFPGDTKEQRTATICELISGDGQLTKSQVFAFILILRHLGVFFMVTCNVAR